MTLLGTSIFWKVIKHDKKVLGDNNIARNIQINSINSHIFNGLLLNFDYIRTDEWPFPR